MLVACALQKAKVDSEYSRSFNNQEVPSPEIDEDDSRDVMSRKIHSPLRDKNGKLSSDSSNVDDDTEEEQQSENNPVNNS